MTNFSGLDDRPCSKFQRETALFFEMYDQPKSVNIVVDSEYFREKP
jgi:hypothetical protein